MVLFVVADGRTDTSTRKKKQMERDGSTWIGKVEGSAYETLDCNRIAEQGCDSGARMT